MRQHIPTLLAALIGAGAALLASYIAWQSSTSVPLEERMLDARGTARVLDYDLGLRMAVVASRYSVGLPRNTSSPDLSDIQKCAAAQTPRTTKGCFVPRLPAYLLHRALTPIHLRSADKRQLASVMPVISSNPATWTSSFLRFRGADSMTLLFGAIDDFNGALRNAPRRFTHPSNTPTSRKPGSSAKKDGRAAQGGSPMRVAAPSLSDIQDDRMARRLVRDLLVARTSLADVTTFRLEGE